LNNDGVTWLTAVGAVRKVVRRATRRRSRSGARYPRWVLRGELGYDPRVSTGFSTAPADAELSACADCTARSRAISVPSSWSKAPPSAAR
jgi:hypothetical protein